MKIDVVILWKFILMFNLHLDFQLTITTQQPLHISCSMLLVSLPYITFDILLLSGDKLKKKTKPSCFLVLTYHLPMPSTYHHGICVSLHQRILFIIIMNVESCSRKVVSCWLRFHFNICCTMLYILIFIGLWKGLGFLQCAY